MNVEDSATASAIELGSLSRPARRPSRSDLSRPFGFTTLGGLAPLTTLEDEGTTPADDTEDVTAVSSATATGAEQGSLTQRRVSRSGSRSSVAAVPRPTLVLTPPISPPDTPESPFEEDDTEQGVLGMKPAVVPSFTPLPEALTFLQGPGDPIPGPSVPPTPLDTPFRASNELEGGSYFAPVDSLTTTESVVGGDTKREISALPPIDGGREALLFLLGACLTEGIVWGLPYSIGVLHEYWIHNMFGPEAEGTLTFASTLPTAMLQFLGFPLGPLFAAMPWQERRIQFAGLFLAAAALVASAFVTKPWHLVLTFGILYPASGAVYLPFASNMFQWYQRYIGLATGAMICGTGVGGTVYPFVVTALLARVGYKMTMIALGISFVILLTPCILLNKRRLPVARPVDGGPRHAAAPLDWSWLRHPSPWVVFACILITSLGGFIPLVWIPSFATAAKVTKPGGTALVAIMNALTIPGNLLAGHLSDRLPVRIVMAAYCAIATVACLLFWGVLGTTPGGLLAFACIWSLTAGSQCATWASLINIFARGNKNVPQLAFGVVMSLRSIGSLTSGPISTAMLKLPALHGAAGAFGNTGFGPLIIFVAAMTFGGSLTMIFFPNK